MLVPSRKAAERETVPPESDSRSTAAQKLFGLHYSGVRTEGVRIEGASGVTDYVLQQLPSWSYVVIGLTVLAVTAALPYISAARRASRENLRNERRATCRSRHSSGSERQTGQASNWCRTPVTRLDPSAALTLRLVGKVCSLQFFG